MPDRTDNLGRLGRVLEPVDLGSARLLFLGNTIEKKNLTKNKKEFWGDAVARGPEGLWKQWLPSACQRTYLVDTGERGRGGGQAHTPTARVDTTGWLAEASYSWRPCFGGGGAGLHDMR